MKHLIFLIFIIIMCLNMYAQNNPSTDYLPMKVGNVFVYQWQQWMISGKYRISITKDTLINGIKYFKNEGRNNSSFTVPYPYSSQFMRVDSLTGNIYGIVNNSVCMIDSLASKLNDSANTCYGRMPCVDTSNLMIFGVSTKTKFFTRFDLSGYSNKYAKGLGIYYLSRLENGPFFTLLGCVVDGVLKGDTSFPVGIDLISNKIPESFRLHQNYPNPFNPVTKIKFDIPNPPSKGGRGDDNVNLIIYNSLGQHVETLVNEQLSPGTYEVKFDGTNYPSGMYYYRLSAGNYIETKKMVLLK